MQIDVFEVLIILFKFNAFAEVLLITVLDD
jgi:hypothetical protein